jgi:NAD(P)-dependent dehydrogenase (short-subunit alcohol dehydrogenase family)
VSSDHFDVTGRVVIVTGGAGLLGREYVRDLAGAGARVVAADVDGAAARAVAADCGGALGIATDVADPAAVSAMVRETLTAFGRIDALVNNAALDPKFEGAQAVDQASPLETQSLAVWQRALQVNVTGAFLCSQAVGPQMLRQRSGAIVNVGSTYGLVGPDQRLYRADDTALQTRFKPAFYSVTKSALLGLTRYLATYWADQGIRVNTLSLGGVKNDHDPGFVERYARRTPLGRMARRGEYCGALRFLISDASSYMTGANLVVDGGWTAW